VQATPTVQRTWRITGGGTTSSFYRLLHRDHLGSVDVVTNGAGALIVKTSFDPFGGRRSITWGSDITTAQRNVLLGVGFEDANSPRGFTDHEHLNRTGFIHMNGRVYDPRIVVRLPRPDRAGAVVQPELQPLCVCVQLAAELHRSERVRVLPDGTIRRGRYDSEVS